MDTVAHSVTVLQKASAMWALVIAGPREVHAPDLLLVRIRGSREEEVTEVTVSVFIKEGV